MSKYDMFHSRSAVYTSGRFPCSLLSLFSFRWMCQLSSMHRVAVYGLLSSTSALLRSTPWPAVNACSASEKQPGLKLSQNVGHALQSPMPQLSLFAQIIYHALFSTGSYCLCIARNAPFSQICSHIYSHVEHVQVVCLEADLRFSHIPRHTHGNACDCARCTHDLIEQIPTIASPLAQINTSCTENCSSSHRDVSTWLKGGFAVDSWGYVFT